MNEQYQVYIKTDAEWRVTKINSSAFLPDVTGYTLIDEGIGDAYHHAQGNYLDKPLRDNDGLHNYYFDNGTVRESTEQEKQAEKASFPAPPPTEGERLAAAESALLALMKGQINV